MASPEKQNDERSPGVLPVPDPTLLTTQQLLREMANLKELLESRLDSAAESQRDQRSIIEARLDGNDRAIKLLQDTADKFPQRIDEKIASLQGVHEEKFGSIQRQFEERDVRDERSSRDSKTAVDAALSAAKEAVGAQNASSALAIAKSETATDKRIDQQGQLISSATKALDDKIDDLKERLTRIEGKGEGVVTEHSSRQQSSGLVVASIAVAVSLILGIAGIAVAILSHR